MSAGGVEAELPALSDLGTSCRWEVKITVPSVSYMERLKIRYTLN